jgi:hypothetical protein
VTLFEVLRAEKDGDIIDFDDKLVSSDNSTFQKEVATYKIDLVFKLLFSVKNKCVFL